MKRILRACFAIVLLLFLVVTFVAGSLIYLIDPNQLKPMLADTIAEKTGYHIAISGKLTWTLYPLLGIKAPHLTITSPGEAEPFIDLKEVTFVTRTKTIWHGFKKWHGTLQVKEAMVMNLHLQHAHIGLNPTDNAILLKPIIASLYDGKLEGMVSITNLNAKPKWQWNMEMRQVQLKPLLDDVNGANNKIELSGIANVNYLGETQGKAKADILMNLNGAGKIAVTNGILQGVDLNYLVKSASDLINRREMTGSPLNQTVFESLTSTFTVSHGVATTNDALLDSSSFITKATGRVDLMNDLQNWQLRIVPVEPGKVKWMIPVLIDGSLKSPSVNLDMQAINAMITREQIEKVKMQVQEKIRDLPVKANQLFQKLLRR